MNANTYELKVCGTVRKSMRERKGKMGNVTGMDYTLTVPVFGAPGEIAGDIDKALFDQVNDKGLYELTGTLKLQGYTYRVAWAEAKPIKA